MINDVVFEKIILYVSTKPMGQNANRWGNSGLDYIMEVLDVEGHLTDMSDGNCRVLDAEAELLRLVPKDKDDDEAAPIVPASA